MPNNLVPDDFFDRQVAVTRGGVDGLVTIIDGQRSVLAAAVQLPLLIVEGLAHVARALISVAAEIADRTTTSSTESLDRLRDSLAVTGVPEQAGNGSTPSRHAASAAAA
jgi:hypothetical protein